MSRAIKFRVWNLGMKRMETPTLFLFGVGDVTANNEVGEIDIASNLNEPIATNHFELMQFTGLTDKNGVEIYEGDAISTDLQRKHNIVVFRNAAFMFQCFDADEEYFDFMSSSNESSDVYAYGEVIGNIHESPELLEAKCTAN